jgi:hypothetical protein
MRWEGSSVVSRTQAFLSYTRTDDEYFGGKITALRGALELGIRVVTGDKNFEIFQDIEGIELGQQWQKRLAEELSGDARFLIPIITPLFFSSNFCRDELGKFIDYEKTTGRDDLILPIYFITTPFLEKTDQPNTDPLALEISKRQRRDWRKQAELPINGVQARREIRNLSEQIAKAIDRTGQIDIPLSPALERIRDNQFRDNSEIIQAQAGAERDRAATRVVLWVDDRPDNNIYERAAMEKYNVRFLLAKSTDEALAKLPDTRFDAIISDMGRPPDPRAGYTLLEAVRSSGNQTPFFIYAGSRAPEHVVEALRRGAQGTTNIAEELIEMVINTLRTEAH